jgi:hypothetical protein
MPMSTDGSSSHQRRNRILACCKPCDKYHRRANQRDIYILIRDLDLALAVMLVCALARQSVCALALAYYRVVANMEPTWGAALAATGVGDKALSD